METINDDSKNFISIIIPVDNSEKYLMRCLDSIINQTFQDFEIICVNNNSSDNSLNILKEYFDETNIKIINVVNKTINELRNIGFYYSNSEYIMFINPEDWLDLDAFYLLYDKLKDKEIDICMYPLISFDGDSFYENGYYDFAGFDEYLKNNTFDYSDILDTIFLIPTTPCNKVYNSIFLKEIMPFSSVNSFDEKLFFFRAIFSAKHMNFINEKFYCKFDNNQIYFNILKDNIDYSNSLLNLFKEFDVFKDVFSELFNYKIGTIKYWFYLVDDEEKKLNFDYIHNDFKLMADFNNVKFSKSKLTKSNQLFFDNIVNSSNWFEFKNKLCRIQIDELVVENKSLSDDLVVENKSLSDDLNLLRNNSKSKIDELVVENKSLFTNLNELKNENNKLRSKCNQIAHDAKEARIKLDMFSKKYHFLFKNK